MIIRLSSSHKSAAHLPNLASEESSDESSEEPSEEDHGLGDPDKSEALFTMYLDRSDEDDRKTTERWKGECDAILTFVSHSYRSCFRIPSMLTLVYRLAFSQSLLQHFLPFPSQAFSRIHRTPRRSISEIFIISSPITPPPSPAHLIRLNFLHRHLRSWSILSGS